MDRQPSHGDPGMIWADSLVVAAVLLILGGVWLFSWCMAQVSMRELHAPACDCDCCVNTALAMVKRDTEKVGAAK
jgi:hypothetical protein